MRHSLLFLVSGLTVAFAAPKDVDGSIFGTSSPTVHTTSGTIKGTVSKDQPNVRQFLGVPFAQPPLGALRWEPPQELPKSAASGTVSATKLPPSCPQYLTTIGNSVYKNDVLEFNLQGLNVTGSTSEDCLTLSVWTPVIANSKGHASKTKLLPVLVFIYGGAFVNGGQDVPYQLPPQWVQRTQDHVVVSFNYRLNIFGYPNAASLSEQNLGLLDQRQAVKWLERNIAAFGGDPSRMILWGQSAGAASADFYNYAFYSDPVVKGLVMDSGTALLPIFSADFSHSNFSFVASKVGCPGLSSQPQGELACMRTVPATTIESFLQQYQDNGTSPSISFVPVPDERRIFSNYTARALQGKLAKLPAIIGTNAQDGVILAPYPVTNPDAGPNQTLVAQGLLNTFVCPATETIRLRNQNNLTTFRYLYAGNFSNIAPRKWMGAYHSAELPMLFGTFDNFRGTGPPFENQTSAAMQDAWVAFARSGSSGLKKTGWQPYQLGGSDVREFGAGTAVMDSSVANLEAQCNGAVAAT